MNFGYYQFIIINVIEGLMVYDTCYILRWWGYGDGDIYILVGFSCYSSVVEEAYVRRVNIALYT
jgi:hypothetical protein